ncbi:hypothetical protein EV215_0128 [Hypnocyclicus thermotrophus]|uniref:YgjP-like metallopeptidase domain-containing protein n=1 Tax=Hypnocyclicus thermotrophus TaxID=1627895 RepID=A0AA46E0N3_9FUSO|nr:SprT family zinc-dependent metalloprotease [Hypnocyclicus thermotrophus]TDT72328.1 hypothetical protein EV215_0128 [Hypnocyclicus thermotrophus]
MEKIINIKGNDIKYKIYKKKKKNISIIIEKNGLVKVNTPKYISNKYIIELIHKKSDWIINKLNNLPKKTYTENNKFYFLGTEYTLVFKDIKEDFILNNMYNHFIINITYVYNSNKIKDLIKNFYLKKSKEYITNRCIIISQNLKLIPIEIRIRNLKRSFGICYSNKKITFNYKIIMCRQDLIDYVIIHELMHLKHMNHSKEFWKDIEKILPNYKKLDKELKTVDIEL